MNIADIVVVIVLAMCMYFGWKKGFVVAAIEFTKWVFAIIIARLFHVQFVDFITKNIWDPTEKISKHVQKYFFDFFGFDPVTGESLTGQQIEIALESIKLPPYFSQKLSETIGNRIVDSTLAFIEIVTVQVTEMIVQGIGFLLLVVILLSALGILQVVADFLTKLPILKELNQGGGLIIGAMIGIVTIYFGMSLLSFFPTFKWTEQAIATVEQSSYAVYFFKYNLLQYTFNTVLVNGKINF